MGWGVGVGGGVFPFLTHPLLFKSGAAPVARRRVRVAPWGGASSTSHPAGGSCTAGRTWAAAAQGEQEQGWPGPPPSPTSGVIRLALTHNGHVHVVGSCRLHARQQPAFGEVAGVGRRVCTRRRPQAHGSARAGRGGQLPVRPTMRRTMESVIASTPPRMPSKSPTPACCLPRSSAASSMQSHP